MCGVFKSTNLATVPTTTGSGNCLDPQMARTDGAHRRPRDAAQPRVPDSPARMGPEDSRRHPRHVGASVAAMASFYLLVFGGKMHPTLTILSVQFSGINHIHAAWPPPHPHLQNIPTLQQESSVPMEHSLPIHPPRPWPSPTWHHHSLMQGLCWGSIAWPQGCRLRPPTKTQGIRTPRGGAWTSHVTISPDRREGEACCR